MSTNLIARRVSRYIMPIIIVSLILIAWLLLSGQHHKSHFYSYLLDFLCGVSLYAILLACILRYGHIDETGIRYNSFSSFLMEQTISWSQVENPVYLRLIYSPFDTRYFSRGFNFGIIIQTVRPKRRFTPWFSNSQEERCALLKILAIIVSNQKQIVAYSHNLAVNEASKSLEISMFFNEIREITPIKIRDELNLEEHHLRAMVPS